MDFFPRLVREVEALLPGLVVAGLFILSLVVLRLRLRGEPIASRLRFPLVLLGSYLMLFAALVGAQLYWPRVVGALSVIALCVLALAVILALAFGFFDLFLGRYRKLQTPKILRDIAVLVVYAMTIFIVLGNHGVNLTSILTTSAVLTAIVGFALQDLLSSVISGLALQIERPFREGDWVRFNEQEGKILEINWRSTKLETLHNDVVVIPNNLITRTAVINFTSPSPIHRRKLTLGLRYEVPPNRAKASILAAVGRVEGVLADPEPFVVLESYDDFSIGYKIHFFIDRFRAKERIEDRVFSRIWYQLKRDGLSIPFPIRDVNVRQVTAEAQRRERRRDHEQIAALLAEVSLLEPLSAAERDQLAKDVRRVVFAAGETVLREGDAGDSFYLVAEGVVEVRVGSKRRLVATLSAGDYFGEMSLMTGEGRAATVVAKTDSQFYVIDRQLFRALIAANEALVEAIAERLERRRQLLDDKREDTPVTSEQEQADVHASLARRIRRFFNIG